MSKTDDILRTRFAEAIQERDAIFAQTEPLRAQRDAILAKARKLEQSADPLTAQITAIETNGALFDLCNEISTIARALRPSGELVSNTAPADA
ncbi:MAG TPA: hypothetical protein DEA80_14525 [Afipia sp.]|nr:hypothetical protein [Afipia sp.]OUX62348.1 MAG: hypothetical protein CBB64_04375 [Afipia sp. TMED4]HBF53312.1 hypothetical protein [Afipia sp.]HBR46116.1 hypothetical protein [Afipia sp.]HCX19043.1 hypothetical protein [Afipia sp.]|tara:strand:- start:162 stop:440 length:279 start_codon:yes stop_codon:yes gene_type:complete